MTLIGSIIALVLGIIVFFWATFWLIDLIAAIVAIAGAIWLLRHLTSKRNRTDL